MAEMDEEKRNASIALSAKYIVKDHSSLLNDGNDLFYVYAHYPTTEPNVMVMPFVSKVNAELFCEALNAENERREVDLAKLSGTNNVVVPYKLHSTYTSRDGVSGYVTNGECICGEAINSYDHKYCPECGKRILWEKVK